jgi:acetylornithine deacetylase/succinyl-diaminopimelate desuccinylase-like protein
LSWWPGSFRRSSPALRDWASSASGTPTELAADLLIASDGPRVAAGRPTIFLGSRGSAGFTLRVALRERSCHSGNWGGLLRNPATIPAGGEPGDPDVDQDWGERGLTPSERVYGANTLEVLSLAAGSPGAPVSAIPGSAHAHCQLRFVTGTPAGKMTEALRNHLDQHGFTMVAIEPGHLMNASRTDPGNPWVRFALAPLARQALRLMAALFWDLGEHTGAL